MLFSWLVSVKERKYVYDMGFCFLFLYRGSYEQVPIIHFRPNNQQVFQEILSVVGLALCLIWNTSKNLGKMKI